jgi:hypothetical protein
MDIESLKPGQRVRITQTIDRRDRDWQRVIVGVVQGVRPEKTASWFAHTKDGQYWVWRIRLAKDDGELTTINVDPHTRVELLDGEPTGA